MTPTRIRQPFAALLLTTTIAVSLGCREENSASSGGSAQPKKKSLPVRVLVVDDPPLASAVEVHWKARAEGGIEVRQIDTGGLLQSETPRLAADLIIYPSGLIGELASRQLISPLDATRLDDPQFAKDEVFPLQRVGEVRWGDRVYAIPFGSPQLTLYYRRDIFESLGLAPPRTWGEYLELARRLADPAVAGQGDSEAWYPAIEPLGPGWAGPVLLARAAAYARHRSQFSTLFDARTMEPLISGPPFVRALDELVTVAGMGPSSSTTIAPADVRREFAAGRCAMALSWPSRTATADDSEVPAAVVATGFAELPGDDEVYNFRAREWEQRGEAESGRVTLLAAAGRLGSVTRECQRPNVALGMLFFLSGDELSSEISAKSSYTTLYRESHVKLSSRWIDSELDGNAARQYGEAVRSAQSRPTWLGCLRIPGRGDYLAALDTAVHQAVAGKDPEQALQVAADRWRQITESLGREQQRQAYCRGIGLEP